MGTIDEGLMAEFAAMEPVYVDGRIEPLINLGDNFASYYFRWVPMQSQSGAVIYRRTAALLVIRPMASLEACRDCKVAAMAAPPSAQPEDVDHRLN